MSQRGLSAYLDTSALIPTLIAEPSTEAVFDWLGANRELLAARDLGTRRGAEHRLRGKHQRGGCLRAGMEPVIYMQM